MADDIPIEPLEEDEQPPGTLGPASIEEAMRPLSALLGEDVVVFIRDDVDSADVAIGLVRLGAPTLVGLIPALIGGRRPGLTLVSDGQMSHAVTVLEERGGRLLFFDPWNTSSFLQDGRNLAGVQAKTEGQGQYSITADELTRVIVAQGVAGLEKVPGLIEPASWDAFRGGDFYGFFHLRPVGDPVPLGDGVALPHKPGAFTEYLDFGFELDGARRLRAGVIEVDQAWLLGPGRMLGLDILKSFVQAVVTRDMSLTPLGVVDPSTVASPDLHLTDALVDVLSTTMRGRRPAIDKRLNRLWPIVAVIGGQSDEAQVTLMFTSIRAVSRAGTLLLRIEQRVHAATASGDPLGHPDGRST